MKEKISDNHLLGHTLLRISIGLLFLISGIKKFSNPDGIIGLLGNIGFPLASFFGWILLLSEIVFGFAVLVGYKTKYTTWPLAFVLLIAALTVAIPNGGITSSNSFFHIIGIFGLITIALTGPGKWSATKE